MLTRLLSLFRSKRMGLVPVLLLLLGSCAQQGSQVRPASGELSSAPTSSPSGSAVVNPAVAVKSEQVLTKGVVLDPPTQDQIDSIGVSFNQAEAWAENAAQIEPEATSITPELGVYTDSTMEIPGYADVLAWDLHMEGCFAQPGIPLPGGGGASPVQCSPTRDAVYDAMTGAEVEQLG